MAVSLEQEYKILEDHDFSHYYSDTQLIDMKSGFDVVSEEQFTDLLKIILSTFENAWDVLYNKDGGFKRNMCCNTIYDVSKKSSILSEGDYMQRISLRQLFDLIKSLPDDQGLTIGQKLIRDQIVLRFHKFNVWNYYLDEYDRILYYKLKPVYLTNVKTFIINLFSALLLIYPIVQLSINQNLDLLFTNVGSFFVTIIGLIFTYLTSENDLQSQCIPRNKIVKNIMNSCLYKISNLGVIMKIKTTQRTNLDSKPPANDENKHDTTQTATLRKETIPPDPKSSLTTKPVTIKATSSDRAGLQSRSTDATKVTPTLPLPSQDPKELSQVAAGD
jgi:hypothetical protein